jgi:hypothetical protein
MKFRMGFVSNSSTSSFCVFGVWFESGELEELLKAEDDDLYETIDSLCCKLGLNYYNTQYDGWVVGIPYTDMEQEETRKAFEGRAKALVEQFTGKETKCGLQKGTYPS